MSIAQWQSADSDIRREPPPAELQVTSSPEYTLQDFLSPEDAHTHTAKINSTHLKMHLEISAVLSKCGIHGKLQSWAPYKSPVAIFTSRFLGSFKI